MKAEKYINFFIKSAENEKNLNIRVSVSLTSVAISAAALILGWGRCTVRRRKIQKDIQKAEVRWSSLPRWEERNYFY